VADASAPAREGSGRKKTPIARVALGRAVAGTGGAARNDLQVNCLCRTGLMENEVQDDQYDQRDAKKPAEKIRHDVISFRIEV
jgi:hypothetical protein